MAEDLPSRVAVLEANQTSHERYCNERAERTANDLSAIRQTNEDLRKDLAGTAGRIHQRIDDTAKEIAAVASAVSALPEQLSAKITISAQSSKLETYAQYGAFVMAAVAIIGLAIDYFSGK